MNQPGKVVPDTAHAGGRAEVGPPPVRDRTCAEVRPRPREPEAGMPEHLSGQYRMEVVDLIEDSRLAADNQILVVPTLARKLPRPLRRIVGDLSDADRLLGGLQLRLRPEESR